MPRTLPFRTQKHKWFTVLIFLILPFYVLYRLVSGTLPDLKDVGNK